MIHNKYQISLDFILSLQKENKYLQAKESVLQLLNEISGDSQIEFTTELYYNLGKICFNLGELELSEHYYELAVQTYTKLGNVGGIANSYGGIGTIYLVKSEYAKATAFFENSIDIYEKIDGIEGIARNQSNLGLVYIELSDYHKAIECFEKALLLNEQVRNKEGIATNFGNFGIVYYNLSDFERAIQYFQKAIELYQELGKVHERIIILGNIGSVYLATKQLKKSSKYYKEAIRLSIQGKHSVNIATNYGNLGIIYKELQNYEKAIEYYQKSLEINTQLEQKVSIGINYFNLAEAFFLMNDFVSAQSYLDNSIQLGKELPNKQILQECFRLQSEIFESTRKYKQSIKYIRQHISLKEEIQTEKSLQKAVIFDEKRKIELEDKQREVKFARLQEQEKLLHNILPINIADRILQNETFIADYYESVSVLFMDLVEFTPLSSIAPPKQLVYILDTIFTKADEIVESFGLEKIKTIGDGYLAVANVTTPLELHQKATALAAIELQKTLKDFEVSVSKDLGDIDWIQNHKIIEIRIGIHTGEVVAGVIGKHKYTYDLWGDAVNVASRMESNSEAGRIHISEAFAKSIEQYPEFSIIPRGEISVKGKGMMNTYWLEKSI